MTGIMNWAKNATRHEYDQKMLEKAREREQVMISKGYRYVQVNPRTRILVECDKRGKPTKKGQEYLDKLKEMLYL